MVMSHIYGEEPCMVMSHVAIHMGMSYIYGNERDMTHGRHGCMHIAVWPHGSLPYMAHSHIYGS